MASRIRSRSGCATLAVAGALVAGALVAAACSPVDGSSDESATDRPGTSTSSNAPASTTLPPTTLAPTTLPSTTLPSTTPEVTLPTRPPWLGTRDLTLPDGSIATGLETPPELLDRRFATIDLLPPPDPTAGFVSSIGPLEGEMLAASTWEEGCPVEPDDLRLLTLTFWGFDDQPHTGDMIVHADVADDVVFVFARLFDARFPIEEMRVITDADLVAPNSGDGNVTSAFVCRAVRGGSTFSEHAHGLAIDINPFLNPYLRGEVLLPELAAHYLPRELAAPGQITEGDVVTEAFAEIGWHWGGNWSSLVDYQHFALRDR